MSHPQSGRLPGRVRGALAVVAAVAIAFGAMLGVGPSRPAPAAARSGPPVLAYYYMWFNAQSWTQRKTDLPALGAYDSTNADVIRQQVAWAKAAGVDALIASWKQTSNLDQALADLVEQCRQQGLKLVLIYEGLDVNRNPIPVSTVSADMRWFVAHYGSDPVFDLYGKPAIVWSGSWKFSNEEIAGVRAQLGAPGSVLLLGSEKDAASYTAKASLFDGDAYYWSSADPESTPGYQKRLDDLSAAVHADRGLWLAPAAVGFDARLNGGTSIVDRRNGDTLRAAWKAAQATKPDGIAVISWNEYTENSYVEPSQKFGATYVNVLAGLTGSAGIPAIEPGTSPPAAGESQVASGSASAPAATATGHVAPSGGGSAGSTGTPADRLLSFLVAGLIALAVVALVIAGRRGRRGARVDAGATGEVHDANDAAAPSNAGSSPGTPSAGTPPSGRRRRGIAAWLGGIGLVLVLVALVVVWAIPNVAGSQFIEVRPVLSAVSAQTGPSVVLGGGTSVRASAVSIAVDVVNRYPLPVVVGVPDVAFRAAVYQRDEAGQLHRVWEATAGDPTIEEGSDSPVAQSAMAAATVASGRTRHDLSSAGQAISFPLTSGSGTQRAAGIYYVRVWAYGIAGDLVPISIDAG